MTDDFSVLMSIYYKENPLLFRGSLDSILNQTIQPSEIILVKDGPLPASLDSIIEEYKAKMNLIVIQLPTNRGLGGALREGLLKCSHELVARMDTDDFMPPTRFEKQLLVFKQNPSIDVCGAWIDRVDMQTDKLIDVRKRPENDSDIKKYAISKCPVCHAVTMFKKESVLNAGNYISFPLFEDYYLWARMILKGSIFYNIQESLYSFRCDKNVIKRRGGWKHTINEFRFQKKLLEIGFLSLPQFIKNVTIRCSIRIIPTTLREFIYKRTIFNSKQ